MAHGAIIWAELMTPDVEAAKAHYAAVAGWTFEAMDMPDETYWVARREGEAVAGMWTGRSVPVPVPPHWLLYIEVDDVDRTVEVARETGGTVVREPFDVPGVGRIAIITEPSGATVGVMTPAAQS